MPTQAKRANPMSSILKAIESAKANNPFFMDAIAELNKNRECLIPVESNYLQKMTGISFGTVTTCLREVEQFKDDQSRHEYETLDEVFYALKNFVINKLRANVTYTYWQDCWKEFTQELVKA